MYTDRLKKIVNLAYESLYEKIAGGVIIIENEASLQLQFSSIIKTIAEIYIYQKDELFSIELEKPVILSSGVFSKSNSSKARIDIFISIENLISGEKSNCAIELKFFKKANHREPNNRYDVFKDIHNLENYGDFVNMGILLVATDHEHYISQEKYSSETSDFDFRENSKYIKGTQLEYKTNTPYGKPIVLNNTYIFKWKRNPTKISFMLLDIKPNTITSSNN